MSDQQENERYDVYLDYNHEAADEGQVVEVLAFRLRNEESLKPFFDKWHIIPGKPKQEEEVKGLLSSRTAAVFVGLTGVSGWQNEYMRAALDQAQRKEDDFRVIPVLLPGATEDKLDTLLMRRAFVDFRPGLDTPEAFQRLVAGIKGEVIEVAGFNLPDEPAPYRGLLRFERQDAEYFFGRKLDTQRLIEKIEQYPFVAVIGASGAGKSSLVRAGLWPELNMDAIPGSRNWQVLMFTPGKNPLRALADQLATLLPPSDRVEAADQFEARLKERPDGLRTAIRTLLADQPRPALLIIDQFEEIFTHCVETPEDCRVRNEILFANLADAIQNGEKQLYAVITLRADFLNPCLSYAQLKELLQDHQLLLGALDEPALRDAIVQPAQKVGAMFEKGLVSAILRDVGDQPGQLPLLQVALDSLWRLRRGPWLTIDAYEKSGGVSGALERRASDAYEGLNPEQKALARSIFMRLISLGEGVKDTRRRADREEIYPAGVDKTQVDAVIQALSGPQARLVVADEGAVEIAHDALIQQWSTLRKWLETNRQALAIHRRLTEDAEEWDEQLGRDPESLYSGARLALVRDWYREHPDDLSDLNELEKTFLDLSLAKERNELEEAQRNLKAAKRRQAILASLLALAVLATLAAVYFGVRTYQQAQVVASQLLAAQSQVNVQGDLPLGLLLAVEALNVQDTIQARSSLLAALQASPYAARTLYGHRDDVLSVAYAPSGDRVVSGSLDGAIRLWDPATGLPLGNPLTGHRGAVRVVAYNRAGDRFVSGGDDGKVIFWDPENGTKKFDFQVVDDGMVLALAFSPQDLYLAYAGTDGLVWLWESSTQQKRLASQSKHSGAVNALAFSADGRYLASGGDDKKVLLVDLQTGEEIDRLQAGANFLSLAFHPTQPLLAYGMEDGGIRFWDGQERKFLDEKIQGPRAGIRDLSFNSNGRLLVSASQDGLLRIWDAATRKAVGKPLEGHEGQVWSLDFNPVNPNLLISGAADTRLIQWDISRGPTIAQRLLGQHPLVYSMALSPDGKILALGHRVDSVTLWDPEAGKQVGEPLKGHSKTVNGLAFSPDSRLLASASSDGSILLWNLTEQTHETLPTPTGNMAVWDVAFSPDGQKLAAAFEDGTLVVWDLDSRQMLSGMPLEAHYLGALSLAFSPDSRRLATTGADGRVILWNTTKWEQQTIASLASDVRTIAFSPDGGLLAFGGDDRLIYLWDVKEGKYASPPLVGHSFNVTRLAFSPDGSLLASGQDQTIFLWDIQEFALIGRLLGGHTGVVYGLAFTPDGSRLISAGEDYTVRWWNPSPQVWQAQACAIANRNLSQDEWDLYRGDGYKPTCPSVPAGEAVP